MFGKDFLQGHSDQGIEGFSIDGLVATIAEGGVRNRDIQVNDMALGDSSRFRVGLADGQGNRARVIHENADSIGIARTAAEHGHQGKNRKYGSHGLELDSPGWKSGISLA